jgi:hypothetical protein
MYGVSADLPLQPFVGKEFNQIALGRFQIQLHASGTGSLFVEGRWELRSADGTLVDAEEEHELRTAFRLHRILDVPIRSFHIDPSRAFTLTFGNGLSLTVFDDSEQYESFSLHLDGRPSLYV